MIHSFDYRTPTSLKEACGLLWDFREEAKVIAGGTDLAIGLRNGSLRPRCLVDITRIGEIRKIEEEEDWISIGAGATHSDIASSSLLHRFGRVLSVAASSVGSPQIRNLGTLGGNIVNASPAADTLPPLMVLDAVGRVASKDGERDIPLVQLFPRPYETILKPFEILTHVRFPKLPAAARSGFIRLARREAMAVARMSVAVIARLEAGRFQDIRISAGSVTPTPHRMSEAERILKERVPDEESLRLAARRVSETVVRWSGVRPSTAYKVPVIEALFLRAMKQALEGLG
jgi:CO/xanthine dehydrogenase FAD-binding subunit